MNTDIELRVEPVSKCLEKKLLILGYEVFDILSIFLTLSILNLLFSSTNSHFLLIWLPTIILALTLKIGKRGKPDNCLKHLAQFHIKPKYYSAFIEVESPRSPKK